MDYKFNFTLYCPRDEGHPSFNTTISQNQWVVSQEGDYCTSSSYGGVCKLFSS